MWQRIAADALVLLHFAFVLFVVGGGLLVWRWSRLAWLHVPCALYGAAIELVGWICPLTPLEQSLRRAAGGEGYTGGFIDHYVRDVLYPASWNRVHVWLGVGVAALNVGVYGALLWRRLARRRDASRVDTPGGSVS